MNAGAIDKKVITTAKKECPIICWRTAKSDSSWLWRWKFAISWACRPNNLASMMPDTDRVSWVIAVTSAIERCASDVTWRRFLPTTLVSAKKKGTVATATIVSCQDRISIATMVLMNITVLDMVSVRVLVTTDWMPPTSLETRDCISPVRVLVKNPSDMP